jgi:exosortase
VSRALGVALALSIGWLYAGVLSGLVAEWVSSPDASYGIILASVALLVAWRRRDSLIQAIDPAGAAAPGAAVMSIGLAIYLAGQLGADLFLTRISLLLVVAGALWFLAGWRALRTLAAPMVFLALAVPLPSLVASALTLPLQLTASRVAEASLTTMGVAVFRDGNVLELPSTALEVAEACSGLRSIISLAAISVLLAWMEPSLPRRIAIVALSLPVAIVMNGFRIAATGLACETWGPKAASGSWHTFSGWITFVASMFVLVQLQRLMSRGEPTSAAWTPRHGSEQVEGTVSA